MLGIENLPATSLDVLTAGNGPSGETKSGTEFITLPLLHNLRICQLLGYEENEVL
jgi:hypothetical protein